MWCLYRETDPVDEDATITSLPTYWKTKINLSIHVIYLHSVTWFILLFKKAFFIVNFAWTSQWPLTPTHLQPCDITVMVGLTLQSRFQCVVHFIPLHRFLHTQMPKTDLVFLLVKKTEKCQRTWRSGGKNEKSYILLKIEMINFMSWYMYILFNSAMYCHVQVCKMWWRWKTKYPNQTLLEH